MKNKKIGIVYLMIGTVLMLTNCNSSDNPSITQEVDYVHDDWEYQYPVDTIYLSDGDIHIIYEEHDGYVLFTESKDFSTFILGDAKHIDSMKCIVYNKVKQQQIELNKLRDLKSCD